MNASDNVAHLPAKLPRYGEARVPAGEYTARFVGCETWARCHGWAPRVVMLFAIVDPPHVGVVIPGFYRVVRLLTQPRRNGRFQIGTRARLYRDLARMLDRRPPTDVVPVDDLVNALYTIVVRDVSADQDKHPLGAATYSVVDWIRGKE